MNTAPALSVDKIDVFFDEFHALKSVSIDVARGNLMDWWASPAPVNPRFCVQ